MWMCAAFLRNPAHPPASEQATPTIMVDDSGHLFQQTWMAVSPKAWNKFISSVHIYRGEWIAPTLHQIHFYTVYCSPWEQYTAWPTSVHSKASEDTWTQGLSLSVDFIAVLSTSLFNKRSLVTSHCPGETLEVPGQQESVAALVSREPQHQWHSVKYDSLQKENPTQSSVLRSHLAFFS